MRDRIEILYRVFSRFNDGLFWRMHPRQAAAIMEECPTKKLDVTGQGTTPMVDGWYLTLIGIRVKADSKISTTRVELVYLPASIAAFGDAPVLVLGATSLPEVPEIEEDK